MKTREANRHNSDAGDRETYPAVDGWRCSMAQYEADPEREEARANLFDAAPDLLAIGKRLVSDVCKPGEDMVELQVSRADYEAFKAAIAKAGG